MACFTNEFLVSKINWYTNILLGCIPRRDTPPPTTTYSSMFLILLMDFNPAGRVLQIWQNFSSLRRHIVHQVEFIY